ncbi:MAG TPA: hypothetical protein VGQ96_07175, partial [Candidatus Eremiobacteraceae bacterium]|nr:hypothetical protein [Candidatus Eremiobacteraceae bacterium]
MSDDKVVELRGSGLWSPEAVFDRAKEQWRIVAAEADHLVREDSPFLAEYCLNVALSEMTNAEMKVGGMLPGGKASPWLAANDHAVSNFLMLSHRLGLNPQVRFYRAKKAELLAATPPLDRSALVARFDAIEKRLDEQDLALQVMD